MTATKTNERPGTRAQLRYLRMSASKARVVLDLIRNKHVAEASQILDFSERLAAKEIQKVLRSAVANAEHNDEIPADELYISACYADEGPTLKRFRPRARGRAGRIQKQTCHITIIVSRMATEELDRLREKATSRGSSGDAAANRRARVARSRGEEEVSEEAEATAVEEAAVEEAAVEEAAVEETAAEAEAEVTEAEVTEAEVTEAEDADAPEAEASDGDADDAEAEQTNEAEADEADGSEEAE